MDAAKKLKVGMLLSGVIFFFNPCVNLVDILPDFIGCILMLAGLYALRDLCGYFEDARRDFLRLFWVSLSKIPAFVIMFSISQRNVNEKTTILLFTFVYAVIEGVLLIVAFGNLLDGFVYAGERYGFTSPFVIPLSKRAKKRAARLEKRISRSKEESFAQGEEGAEDERNVSKPKSRVPREKSSGKLYYLTLLFVIAVKVLNVLPELVYLSNGREKPQGALNLEEYKNPLIALSVLAGLILGILWLNRMRRYLKNILSDQAFSETLLSQYEIKTAEAPQLVTYRKIRAASLVFTAALAFSFDFFLDEYNIIPDIISALLFFAGAVYAAKQLKFSFNPVIGAGAFYAVTCAVLLAAANIFRANYSFSSVGRVDEASALFAYYAAAEILAELAFIAMFLLLAGALKKLVKTLFAEDTVSALTYTKERNAKVYGVYSKKITRSGIAALIVAAVNAFYLFTLADTNSVSLKNNDYTALQAVYMPQLEGFWMINALVTVIWIIYTARIFSGIAEEYRDKYFII